MLGRYGGEEFLLLLMEADVDNAMDVASHPFAVEERALTLTISVGLTMARRGDTVDSVIRRADRAVYQAKAGGRNQTRVN